MSGIPNALYSIALCCERSSACLGRKFEFFFMSPRDEVYLSDRFFVVVLAGPVCAGGDPERARTVSWRDVWRRAVYHVYPRSMDGIVIATVRSSIACRVFFATRCTLSLASFATVSACLVGSAVLRQLMRAAELEIVLLSPGTRGAGY